MKQTLLFFLSLLTFPIHAQFLENFDDASVTAPTGNSWTLPSGTWKTLNTATVQRWTLNDASHAPNTAPNAAYLPTETTTIGQTSMDVLVSPLVNLPPNAVLKFKIKHSANSAFAVFTLPATANIDDPATFSSVTFFDVTPYPNDVYYDRTLPVGSSSEPVYIVFRRMYTQLNATPAGEILLDDIMLLEDCWTINPNSFEYNLNGTLSWPNPQLAANFEVHVVQAGTTFDPNVGTPFSVSQNSIFLTQTSQPSVQPLAPGTSYMAYVRGICPGSESIWRAFGPFYKMGFGCGHAWYDAGGPDGNYFSNSNYVITMCPENPGDVVSANFLEFDTEPGFDALYVFDGNSQFSPMIQSTNNAANVPGGLAGGYWGNAIPGPFVSSSPDGCLTFQFRSDANSNSAGWKADIVCEPPADCIKPTGLEGVASGVTALLDWNEIGNAENWEIYYTPCGSNPPNYSSLGTAAASHPFEIEGLTPETCYDFYVRSVCADETNGSSMWEGPFALNTGIPAPTIALKAFIDANQNGVFDNGETPFGHGNFALVESLSVTAEFSSPSGFAAWIADDPDASYEVHYLVFPEFQGYFAYLGMPYIDVVPSTFTGIETLYFPISAIAPYTDLSVTVSSTPARVGMAYHQTVRVSNLGDAPVSAMLDFAGAPVTTVIAVEPAATINGSGFEASVNLGANSHVDYFVTSTIPPMPTVNSGDLLNISASLSNMASDINPENNAYALSMVAVNSYDPNDIVESRGPEIDIDSFSEDDYLYYRIRFQNSGTAEALNIRVDNSLDGQLDSNSFRVVGSSHNYYVRRVNNELSFYFDDINLTWQSNDELLSQGWIIYKVKVHSGFAVGDVIPNIAEIYFDTNPAVVTETFNTEFVDALSHDENSASEFVLYPNPASQSVRVKFNEADNVENIAVFDMLGHQILDVKQPVEDVFLNVSGWAKGIYAVRIQLSDGRKTIKKLSVR